MINVTVGNNVNRKTIIVDPAETTPRKVLEDAEVDYSTANVHLDGVSLQAGDFDKSFDQLGITAKCFLIAVTKTNNA